MPIVDRPDPGVMIIDELLSEDDQKQLLAVVENADLTALRANRVSR